MLSRRQFNQAGHTLLAIITSSSHAPWPGDTPITDLAAAGLTVPCIVRLKLFTLDNRLLIRRIGQVSQTELRAVDQAIRTTLL